jgi:transposase
MRQLEVRLKPWEARQLRELRDHATKARVLKRVLCLLLSAEGEPAKVIAAITGLSLGSISNIRRRWRQDRLAGVADQPRSGRPSRITTKYRQELRRALRKGPLALGYVFTVWSMARLRAYLLKRTGIALSTNRLRQLAHAQGFVIARPKHTLAGRRDEQQYRRTRQRLERLKKGRFERTRPLSSGTPTPPSLTSCRTWSAAGCPRESSWR